MQIPWRDIAKGIEFIAVVLGMMAILYEFGIQRPKDRDLRDAQLYASVATLAAAEDPEVSERAVHKILALLHLEGVDMTGMSFPGVTFRMSDFEGVDWAHAFMEGVEFACTDRMYDLIDEHDNKEDPPQLGLCANLKGANFSGAYMRRLMIRYADLSDSDFTHASLREAFIKYALFTGSKFTESTMRGIEISDADFSGSDFGRFNEFDCRFHQGDAECVELDRVDFSLAEMPFVLFRGAELDMVDFGGSNLRGARIDCDTLLSQEACTSIESVCLEGTDLTRARLEDITVSNTDFSRARMSGASFKNVTFANVVFTEDQIKENKLDDYSLRSLNAARVSDLGLPEDETPCTPAWRQRISNWKASFALGDLAP